MAGNTNPNFSSLAGLLPTNGYKPESGIGGIQSGIQLADYLDSMDRTRRMDDLTFQSETNKFENELLDNPMKESERALKLAQSGFDKSIIDNGTKRQAIELELQTKLEQLSKTKGDNAVQAVTNQASLAEQYMNLESSGQMTTEMRQEYEKKFGVTGLKVDLMSGDPRSKIMLAKMAEMAPIARNFADQKKLTDYKHSRDVEMEDMRHKNAQIRTNASIAGNLEAARIGAKGRDMNMDPARRVLNELDEKPVLTTDDLNKLSWVATSFKASIRDDPSKVKAMETYRNYYSTRSKTEQAKLAPSVEQYAAERWEAEIEKKTNEYLGGFLSGKKVQVGDKMITITPSNINKIMEKIKAKEGKDDSLTPKPEPAPEARKKVIDSSFEQIKNAMKSMNEAEQRAFANQQVENVKKIDIAAARELHARFQEYFQKDSNEPTTEVVPEKNSFNDYVESAIKNIEEDRLAKEKKEEAYKNDPYWSPSARKPLW